MQGVFLHRWIRCVYQNFLLFNFLIFSTPLQAAVDSVLIVKSNNNHFFDTTIQQVIDSTDGHVKFNITALDSLKNKPELIGKPELIIALGFNAAFHLQEIQPKSPVLLSYITEFEYQQLNLKDGDTAVLLEQPLQRYLKFIKILLPLKTVGIIKKHSNRLTDQELKSIQKKLDITLNQHSYSLPVKSIDAVRNLLGESDLLLSLPEPNIYNRQSLKGILLTSYRQKKPVISYSPAHVKSGALAAIYASPKNIGNQIAGLLNQLNSQPYFSLQKRYYADTYNITINDQVAQSLEINLPDKVSIKKAMDRDE